MNKPFNIVNTQPADLPEVIRLFDESVTYQESRGYPSWRNDNTELFTSDIRAGNQYKAVNENGIGIVFTVTYGDKAIWREKEDGQSIYLHRIIVNPAFKGQKLFGVIVEWAKDHIKQTGRKNIRMDTWSNNPTIISYYQSFGFEFVETVKTPNTDELPPQYRHMSLTLLQYKQ